MRIYELVTVRISALALALALAGVSTAADLPSREQALAEWEAGDRAGAVTIWRGLAEQGDPESMLFTAFAYRTGQGTPADQEQAFHWYRKAAEAGMPEAQLELGFMYELGIGTKVDPHAATGWYSMATGGEYCPIDLPAGGRLGDR